MRAGQLRHRVALEKRSTTNTLGQVTESWGTEAVLWAQVTPLSGRELERARMVVADATHEVTIRFRERVTARDRFIHDNRELNIESVRNIDERKQWLVCICVEQS